MSSSSGDSAVNACTCRSRFRVKVYVHVLILYMSFLAWLYSLTETRYCLLCVCFATVSTNEKHLNYTKLNTGIACHLNTNEATHSTLSLSRNSLSLSIYIPNFSLIAKLLTFFLFVLYCLAAAVTRRRAAQRLADQSCEFPATRIRVSRYHAQGCDQTTGEFVGT